jgi:prepilin-type processing-associated H-X9-DG protein
MNFIHQPKYLRGLTMVEVLVVIVAVVVLIGLLLPAKRSGGPARRIKCRNDLKQCGLSLTMWADDHGGKFPFEVSTNEGGSLEYVGSKEVYRHFLSISNELGNPKVLRCPTDQERLPANDFEHFTNTNISYFLTIDGNRTNSWSVLAGDRNIAANKQNYVTGNHMISTNQLLTWGNGLHYPGGNLVFTDGHVEQCNASNLMPRMSFSGQPTNWLAFP